LTDTLLWLEDEFAAARANDITIRLYVTQPDHKMKQEQSEDPEDESIDEKSTREFVSFGRPDIPAIVHQVCETEQGSVGIACELLVKRCLQRLHKLLS
jgi:mannosyltransferase OCH1-like enzyme